MVTFRRACTMFGIGALIGLGVLTTASGPAHAQSWVYSLPGPAPGDSSPRIDAIVLRQMLNIAQSPARLEKGKR